jgi:hypothetical protein
MTGHGYVSFTYLFIYFKVYLTTLSVAPTIPTASNESVIHEWCIGKDMEGSGRCLINGTVPVFVSSNWVQPRNPSVRTADIRAEIWTRNLPNTKQEPLDHEVRLHGYVATETQARIFQTPYRLVVVFTHGVSPMASCCCLHCPCDVNNTDT